MFPLIKVKPLDDNMLCCWININKQSTLQTEKQISIQEFANLVEFKECEIILKYILSSAFCIHIFVVLLVPRKPSRKKSKKVCLQKGATSLIKKI